MRVTSFWADVSISTSLPSISSPLMNQKSPNFPGLADLRISTNWNIIPSSVNSPALIPVHTANCAGVRISLVDSFLLVSTLEFSFAIFNPSLVFRHFLGMPVPHSQNHDPPDIHPCKLLSL